MKQKIQWGRLFRRSTAVFLATMAVWLLVLCAGAGSAAGALQQLGEDGRFVSALLEAELGVSGPGDLEGWERLVVEQSPLFWGVSGQTAQEPSQEPLEPTPEPTSQLPASQPAQDHDDLSEPPAVTAAPGNIVERTLVPSSSEGYVYADGLYLYNRTSLPVDLAAAAAASVNITLPEEGPQVLIVHTHATEAYTPDGTDLYEPSDNNTRTLDEAYNVIRVGDEIERVFTELGLSVIHDRTLYDYPKYNGAYERSGAGIADYLAQHPTIRIVLDIHRDALVGDDGTVYKAVTEIDGVKTAQVMLVLGSSAGGEHPNWTENLALAVRIQRSMDRLYPTLARPLALRVPRYNQHLTNGSLLVEVGCHGNTLQEALAGARLFARSAGQVLLELKESPAS